MLKQDKGRDVVILDRNIYGEKCLSILDTNQFIKLDKNPISSYKSKIQLTLRKIKSKPSTGQYRKFYPTGFNAGIFYGTAKLHKMDRNDKVDKLHLDPIVYNIVTASNQHDKYLAQLLSPLSKSECTVQSSAEFMQHINVKTIPCGYHLIFFNVISFFTNVSLVATIDIVLKRIYHNGKINTTINKRTMKELIKLYDRGIFMVELERFQIIPNLSQHLQFWKRYVDDTICFVCNRY